MSWGRKVGRQAPELQDRARAPGQHQAGSDVLEDPWAAVRVGRDPQMAALVGQERASRRDELRVVALLRPGGGARARYRRRIEDDDVVDGAPCALVLEEAKHVRRLPPEGRRLGVEAR